MTKEIVDSSSAAWSSHHARNYAVFALLLWFVSALIGGWFDIVAVGDPPIILERSS